MTGQPDDPELGWVAAQDFDPGRPDVFESGSPPSDNAALRLVVVWVVIVLYAIGQFFIRQGAPW